MKYIFEINIQTDGDFGFQFVPTGMTEENSEWYTFERSYIDRDKAIEDVGNICKFLRENVCAVRDSVIATWHCCIDNFLTELQNSEASVNECVETTADGNYYGTRFLFRAAPKIINFKFDVTDEEYNRILDHRINVKQARIKAAVLALYDDSADDQKCNWFEKICERLRDYSDGEVWSDGYMILCRSEQTADAIADMIECLYKSDDNEVLIGTGYYDPAEDKRFGEEDRYTGWWYVDIV